MINKTRDGVRVYSCAYCFVEKPWDGRTWRWFNHPTTGRLLTVCSTECKQYVLRGYAA